jgi:hypothetical protein
MAFRTTVKTINNDMQWKKYKAKIASQLSGQEVAVGVRGQSGLAKKQGLDEDGTKFTDTELTVLDIAIINEYGSFSRHIPQRSFIFSVVMKNIVKYREAMKKIGMKYIEFGSDVTLDKILPLLGEVVKRDIQNEIRNGKFEPLARSTLRAREERGFAGTKPLIVTGQLLQSISYEVRNKKQ